MDTNIATPKRNRRTKAQMAEDRANNIPKPKPIGRTPNRIKHDVILQDKRRLARFISKYNSFPPEMKTKFLATINAQIKPSITV